jgi:hypothetical protein
MQRSSRDKSRARASFAVSDMISSGWTARAGDPAIKATANTQERIRFKASLRRLQSAHGLRRLWGTDPQPTI